ncbi:MAG: prolipoprotein diacylglyceryl transferase family protein [Polyangiaceae bacterium]
MPLKLWWAMVAVAVISMVFGGLALKRADKAGMRVSFGVAIIAGAIGYVFRDKSYEAASLPIYSYGVMLALSLIVGWYLTLGLAAKANLPKDTMANCYVLTAIVALASSRLFYVATNMEQFKSIADVLAIRKGGYVAYGGFIGGFAASWLYLKSVKQEVLPWADVAVPSLATGLTITRIGCYLFGCDFGTRLSDGAPGFLKKLGTFPHWNEKTVAVAGEGPPVWTHHRDLFQGTSKGAELLKQGHAFPVHPTQIYEAIVGVLLLVLLLVARKSQRFKGQIFYLFAFAYGAIRFVLEIVRDDEERQPQGPAMSEHIAVPFCLVLFALAFTFGVSLGIQNLRNRMIARVVAFVPAVAMYLKLRPADYAQVIDVRFSTSQWIALFTGLLAAYFYWKGFVDALREEQVKAKAKKKKKKKVEEELEDEDGESELASETAKAADAGSPKPEGESAEAEVSKDDPKPAES